LQRSQSAYSGHRCKVQRMPGSRPLLTPIRFSISAASL
jgi:hypothetical protein